VKFLARVVSSVKAGTGVKSAGQMGEEERITNSLQIECKNIAGGLGSQGVGKKITCGGGLMAMRETVREILVLEGNRKKKAKV